MGKYHNDQPIQGGTNDPDLLNRASFSEHLAEILILDPGDDCLTVSLEGEWGYGKTSIINLIKTHLKANGSSPIIVEYNPWLAGKPESLIQDFLIQFSSKLGITDNAKVALKAAEELISYSSLFSAMKLVPGVEPWASITENVFTKFGNATKKIAKLKQLDLLGKKKLVEQALQKIKKPILVIIDDIDRLTPEESFQVLRLVKSVANFSGTSFLLAFDPQYLSSVLGKNNISKPDEYLNKVVQLRVQLPIISSSDMETLSNVEFEQLNQSELCKQFESDDERLSWIYHNYFKHLIKNPRELKRFFNHLRFVLAQVSGQVCFADLFGLSLLATKSISVYEHLKSCPEAYIGISFDDEGLRLKKPEEIANQYKEERLSKLEIISNQKEKELVRRLLTELFPLTATEDGEGYDLFSIKDNDAAARVSVYQRLYIALHFKTPSNYVSDQSVYEFINGDVARSEYVSSVMASDAEDRLFELLKIYSAQLGDNAFEVLISIFNAGFADPKLKQSQEANYSFSGISPFRKMVWFSKDAIEHSDNKLQLITQVIKRYENAAISVNILYFIQEQHEKNNYGDPWVTKEELTELESIFVDNAIKALNEKIFAKNLLESHLFFGINRINKPKLKEFLNSVLLENGGEFRLADIIMFTGSDSSNGPYTEIDKEKYKDTFDVSLFEQKMLKHDYSELDNKYKAIINTLNDGKKYYLRDAVLAENF